MNVMLSDHATIEREGFTVPLIGIPPGAMLEECDCCHDDSPLSEMFICGGQVLCKKCAETK